MSIIRLIHIKIDPSETETAERIWKTECATLMISQKGCISEKLLRARERGEFISYPTACHPDRLDVVPSYPLTVCVKLAEVPHGSPVALRCGLLEPLARLCVLPRHNQTVFINLAEI